MVKLERIGWFIFQVSCVEIALVAKHRMSQDLSAILARCLVRAGTELRCQG